MLECCTRLLVAQCFNIACAQWLMARCLDIASDGWHNAYFCAQLAQCLKERAMAGAMNESERLLGAPLKNRWLGKAERA
jgi:hypothetical protein